MNIVLVTIALIVVVVGAYSNRPDDQTENAIDIKNEVLSEMDMETVTPYPELTPIPQITPLPTATPVPQADDETPPPTSENGWQYPESLSIGSGIYETHDDAEVVTNWYKEKIRSRGYNVTSFVTTKTNGKVLNKLVGDDGQNKINIKIEKPQESSIVTITVS